MKHIVKITYNDGGVDLHVVSAPEEISRRQVYEEMGFIWADDIPEYIHSYEYIGAVTNLIESEIKL